MYIPEHFRERDPAAIHAFMREHSFATLISQGGGALVATHLPLLARPEPAPWGTLAGHVARGNPQWTGFAGGQEVLAIFHGPHAYVSPSWYATAPAVPTWNYVAVHAYGIPRLIESGPALREIIEETVLTHEGGFAAPWRIDAHPAEYVERMLRGVVGFEIRLTRVEGKAKLSQNRSEQDRRAVVEALDAAGEPDGCEIARLMAEAGDDGRD